MLARHKQPGQSFSAVIKAHFGPQPSAGRFRALLSAVRLRGEVLDAAERQVRARRKEPARAMELSIHLDSSALIDLLRETARERPGPAFDALQGIDEHEYLAVSVHVVCELRVGAELSRRSLRAARGARPPPRRAAGRVSRRAVSPAYGMLLAAIRRSGRWIAAFNLLIATAATLDDAPILTRNVKDFSRVPGLRVIGY